MIRKMIGNGMYIYEESHADVEQRALLTLAQIQAAELPDEVAVQVAALFPVWTVGEVYETGTRIADSEGRLYRVVQTHTAQSDWQPANAPNLFVALGVTTENPDAIPAWVQPVGGHDAYGLGDQVEYEGAVYQSLIAANIYPPTTEFWTRVS